MVPSFAPKSVRQLLKTCWHTNPDFRPKLGSVCLALRDEISGIRDKKSSRSLMERTQHLRFYSKRSLRAAWEALGLPTSSRKLGAVKMGDPSSELKPITEHDPTETSELSLLSRLQSPPSAGPSEVEWETRHLFGSTIACKMPKDWNDLSWHLNHVPENRELWQDGEGESRENCTSLLKVEVREQCVDFDASLGYYYAEAADAAQVKFDRRKWSPASSDDGALVAPASTSVACCRGILALDQAGTLMVELAVLRRSDVKSSMELIVSLYYVVDPNEASEADKLSSTFDKFLRSMEFKDLEEVFRDT
jgi:hypothetical protein